MYIMMDKRRNDLPIIHPFYVLQAKADKISKRSEKSQSATVNWHGESPVAPSRWAADWTN
jgi:hypothetical protein